jgi:hypothetical protein
MEENTLLDEAGEFIPYYCRCPTHSVQLRFHSLSRRHRAEIRSDLVA